MKNLFKLLLFLLSALVITSFATADKYVASGKIEKEKERPDYFPRLSVDWKNAKPIFYDGAWHSDMCMIQDKLGRWHCIGISQPDSTMFHAVGDKLDSEYKYLPRIGCDDPLIEHMWALFAIWKDKNTALLYYSHMSKVSHSIRVFVSHDPKLEKWEPYSGPELKGNLVFSEEGDRDACVFYDRSEKCYLMYYASTGPVKVRKSQDLLHWSEPIVVIETPPMPYKCGESPYVMKKGNWYFLFVSGFDYGRVSVYASKNPYNFGDALKDRLYEISGHAPEMLRIGNDDFMVCAAVHTRIGGLPGESDLNSVYIQKLDWVGWDQALAASFQEKPDFIASPLLPVATPENSEYKIPTLNASENKLINLNLGGYVGEFLASNERSWLQNVLRDNPNMFEAFVNPEGNTLAKAMWHGEFPGKILTGMAQTFRASRNPNTLAAGNKMVQMFKTVQGADGYLGPWSKSARFNGDKNKWDTWGHYHCIYGLYQWYKITGNQDALDIAIKAADCIYNYFIEGNQTFISQNWAECNFAISHVFAILYQETGNKKYLEAAERIVLNEWKLEYHDFYTGQVLACDWLSAAAGGKAFYQSNQTRWESLHTLMTLSTLYQITKKQEYYKALEHYWWSIIQYDRHNFGGFGTGEGATGNSYGNGSETCSTVAWMAYSTEYLKVSKISYVADELEIAYYNAALGSLLDDHDFIYMNDSDGTRVSALITLAGHGFEGGKELSCCQANGNRGISQVTEWAVLNDKENLYINYYGTSNAETKTPGGTGIKILQETEYPKRGAVKITLAMDESEQFKLNLRIPTWSAITVVKVNGEAFGNVMPGDYYVINRFWQTGDVIEIEFDMSIHFWVGEDKFSDKTSIYYGPILLAIDSASSTTSGYKLEASAVKKIVFGQNKNFWFYGLVETTGGKKVALVDYASAGDDGESYTTWLNVANDLDLSGTDFALQSQRQAWMRHPVLGDPSFDNFKRYEKNPVQRGTPPFNWPVNGFYFEDPASGNEYIFAGQYRTGYAMGTDKKNLDISKGCDVYYSEDKGKTWKHKGPAFNEEVVMLDGQVGPVNIAPDVSVVYFEGKYYMGLDYVTTEFSWDIKNIMNGGLAVAVSDRPEGPYQIYSKPAITNRFFYNNPWLGKYNRCYAGTLIKLKNQWVFLFDLDSGTYYSWGLAAISAPTPEGPWSEPVLVAGCEIGDYHPSLMEYFPVFLYKDTLYAPATSVAKNRNFQCIFRAAANEAMNPKKWELWQEGSVWHSTNAENEYEGIWGQTFSGFINKDDVLKVMYPSRDKENRGTINLASVDWNKLHRDTGFVFSGHGSPSFTAISKFYSEPNIESSFSYYGTIAFVWNYQAPVGPDRPKADAELHPLMFSSNTRFQLTENQWLLLHASADGRTDTISRGLLDKREVYSLKIQQSNQKTIISIDNKVLWQGLLKNHNYGNCGLFAMKSSGIDVQSFIVSGRNYPGFINWLYTEGLSNSGSDMKDWEMIENSSLFTYGIGAVSKIDIALAKWSFTGSGFDLYCPKMPALGMAEIIVNGEIVGEINLHSETPEKSAVVYSMRTLTQKKNAIIIKGKNGNIALDCLRVYE